MGLEMMGCGMVGKDSSDAHESAESAVENMRIGWNLGNSLDSTGSWILQGTGEALRALKLHGGILQPRLL